MRCSCWGSATTTATGWTGTWIALLVGGPVELDGLLRVPLHAVAVFEALEETVMVYFDPELIQTMADRSAAKRQNFRELLSAAEEGSLDAAYRLGLNYYEGSDGAPKDEAQALRWLTSKHSPISTWARG